ncbi:MULTISPECIES: diacylglycerol kinase family lipid kinase [unclassified Streptococcus]|uniref:diacylglycerol kinase family lipid kinase n=1 Tax=unclassified Streptococcus TaxID=2608887 RepID=UPI0018A884D5|nr:MULTISPECIES: diacylglycerol kinase family lipid kinase [unclassified Streptococcus]MBF8970661.1 diacylglycerol kinase family lipid kinase [Streptococcus sp. NLN76]MBG9367883.1 diacylglycerol kinase family lipid kinase [Streptococcus sp. NLN64]
MVEERQRARLIYNPTSGQEIMKRYIADVLDVLEDIGYETSAYQTTPLPFSAQKEAERAARAGFDLVIAAGGDGTINEVVNGIAHLAKRPRMAFIPVGTTNDYARALKIPMGDPVAAAKVIAQKQLVEMDIGRAYGDKHFINIAAAGTLSELTYSVPSNIKTRLGYLAYVAKGAEMLPRSKSRKVRLEHDQGVFEGKVSLIFVALTNSIAGFEKLAPDAKLDDGNFTVIVVKTDRIFDMMSLIIQAINGGQHVSDPNVIYIKSKEIKLEVLEGDQQFMLNLDGEYGGDTPVHLEVLPNHLEFYANVDEISDEALTGDRG